MTNEIKLNANDGTLDAFLVAHCAKAGFAFDTSDAIAADLGGIMGVHFSHAETYSESEAIEIADTAIWLAKTLLEESK